MISPKILVLSLLLLLCGWGCADGFLEVTPEQGSTDRDAGHGEDADGDTDPHPADDADVANDGDVANDVDDNGTCCAVGTIECINDHDYRECHSDNGDCGQWGSSSSCPGEQLCDDRDDAEALCTDCRDDDFAPDNFVSQTAPLLSAGTTFENLVLCDNQIAETTSHNFFYLGQISEIDVHLQWIEEQGPLGLDLWTADVSDATWEDRTYLADAGTHPSELSHTQSLGGQTHVYARVFFRTDDKPTAGATYTISHSN